MAGGRPSKLNNELLNIAEQYVEDCTEFGDVVPTVAGLAIAIGTHRETVYAWCRDGEKDDDKESLKAQFSDIVKLLMTQQERKALNGGLDSTFNPMITKLLLSKHGYTDKVEQDITSGGEKLTAPVYSVVKE